MANKMTVEEAIECLGSLRDTNTQAQTALDISIDILKMHIPREPLNQQGIPLFGYCPACNDAVTPLNSPKACKYCLQVLNWTKYKPQKYTP